MSKVFNLNAKILSICAKCNNLNVHIGLQKTKNNIFKVAPENQAHNKTNRAKHHPRIFYYAINEKILSRD